MKKLLKSLSLALIMSVSLLQITGCSKIVEEPEKEETAETFVVSEPEPEPIPEPESEPEPEPEPEVYTVTLCAVGDDLIHDNLISSGKKEDGTRNYDHLYEHILDEIAPFDVKMINQETILIDEPSEYSGYPRFGSPYEIGEAVVKAGFNVVTHATNHSYDKGEKGVLSTVAFWKEHPEVLMTGMYDNEEDYQNISVGTFNNIRIAFLNYTYSLNGLSLPSDKQYYVNTLYDDDKIASDIQKAREISDFVIVCPHWGTEYVYEATNYQRSEAQIFVDNGADLIIGAHPHVVEPLEILFDEEGNEIPCYWSLGNYVSSQNEIPRMLGAMAKVTIEMTEGDERAHLVSCDMEPIVTHITSDCKSATTYMLKDYTEELAAEHRLTKTGKTITVEKMWELYESITVSDE